MAVKKSSAFIVSYYDCDDMITAWSECSTMEDAMEEAKLCLTENDTDTAFIAVKSHKITKDYKVEKL